MSNYSDALFHANRETDAWKERYEELAKRCAAAEAQAKAAGELLRAAKDTSEWLAGINVYEGDDPNEANQHDNNIVDALKAAVEAAERAGVKP